MISCFSARARLRASCAALALMIGFPAFAADDVPDMPEVVIKEKPTVMERYKLPNTSESITREKLADTVNIIDTEDAVKYMPSLSVRKRNNGDTQAILMTRTWGYNSSARSLVYADDVLISALIANDNTRGGPNWGLVAPEEIERVDMMYGPFSAQHSGNAMGGVLQITTRMPEQQEATLKQTESLQYFSLYNTKDTYRTDQTSATYGNKFNKLSLFLSANTENSFAQPVSMVTNAGSAPAGTTGQIAAVNKIGSPTNIIGAGGLLHTEMQTFKAKAAYDLTSELKLSYLFGFWQNHGRSRVESYLKDASGNATYGTTTTGTSFANANYILEQMRSTHAVSLKSDTKGMWDVEATATHVQYDHDVQKQPRSTTGGLNFTTDGKYAQMDGTNWSTLDGKAIFRPEGVGGAHEASAGVHFDRYILVNTTYNTANWRTESPATGRSTDSRGVTQTTALWAQDVWKLTDTLKFTGGGRYEVWEAFKGFVMSTATSSALAKPSEQTAFSPKGSLSWEFMPQWTVTGSAARSTRFPTVSELYLTTGTGTNTAIANPNLRPERVNSYELAFETTLGEGKTRLSFFQENVTNALISQTTTASTGGTASFVSNVDEIRNRGIEAAASQSNVLFDGFDLSGSLTYVDAEIIRDAAWAGTAQVAGKPVPNIPMWRSTMVASYRPNDEWTLTGAARYQARMSSNMDATDHVNGVYGAFDSFMVLDLRARYKHSENLEAALGVDNVNNCKYWEFHPFPQRTFIAELKVKL
ncbi:MAG: TonB-dependent receptor [Magnetospirillum sp.]|nr:TonB-dependent receptor [Magnetospirillum sp.]